MSPTPHADILLAGCNRVPVQRNTDARGCLFEIFRESWPGAFKTVQWNACASNAGVMRGVHVHADYDEFYTLPRGRVFIALKDIRRSSKTFLKVAAFEWSSSDGFAVPIPAGVAHAVYFLDDSVLAFGLSGYWNAEYDVLGCHWQALDSSIRWPVPTADLSPRDSASGTFAQMQADYEALTERMHRS